MGGATETVLEEEKVENVYVPEQLQERLNQFLTSQKVLLEPDALDYLHQILESKHGIIWDMDYFRKGGVKAYQDLVQAVGSETEEVKRKGGIDPKYISQALVVNPESAKDLVFEGKELLENKLDHEFESDEEILQFFAGENQERKSILQKCMEGEIEEFLSDLYLDILQIVDTLRKVAPDDFLVRIRDKVPGRWILRRLEDAFEGQDIFPRGRSFLKYVSNRLKSEYNIERHLNKLRPDYLEGRLMPKNLADAVDSIAKNIVFSGGISPEKAHLGGLVYSKKVIELMDKALEIIEHHYRKRPRSNKSRDDHFGNVLSTHWLTLYKYRSKTKFAKSIILKRMYRYVNKLNRIVLGELEEEIDLPDKYFIDIDKGKDITEKKEDVREKAREPEIVFDREPEEKPVVGKTIPEEPKVIFDRKSEEMLEYMWREQNLFPYKSCRRFVINKLKLDYGMSLGKKYYKPEEVMSALESIANEIKQNKGIKPSEAHLGTRVYSERIAELIEKIDEIYKNRRERKYSTLKEKEHFFAGIASTTSSIIRFCILGVDGGGSKTGPSQVYQKLYEFVHNLNRTEKQRRVKGIK